MLFIKKETKLRFYYWTNIVQKNFFKYLVVCLFGVSILLSLGIILPNFTTHTLFMIGIENPRILQIEGLILEKDEKGGRSPLAGSMIEIGGYKTNADQDGKYRLKFLSKAYDDIPVVIQSTNGFVIKRISFRCDEYKKTEEFILDGK